MCCSQSLVRLQEVCWWHQRCLVFLYRGYFSKDMSSWLVMSCPQDCTSDRCYVQNCWSIRTLWFSLGGSSSFWVYVSPSGISTTENLLSSHDVTMPFFHTLVPSWKDCCACCSSGLPFSGLFVVTWKEGFLWKDCSCSNSAPVGWVVVSRYALERVLARCL